VTKGRAPAKEAPQAMLMAQLPQITVHSLSVSLLWTSDRAINGTT